MRSKRKTSTNLMGDNSSERWDKSCLIPFADCAANSNKRAANRSKAEKINEKKGVKIHSKIYNHQYCLTSIPQASYSFSFHHVGEEKEENVQVIRMQMH